MASVIVAIADRQAEHQGFNAGLAEERMRLRFVEWDGNSSFFSGLVTMNDSRLIARQIVSGMNK